ncbi:MAG: Rne/Rng family ribonuclease [Victivallales bacterium]|nr:Rne/Rng family ribonuclease [Victivallales bacterium]
MKQILINSEELQTRVAVIQDGVLQDFFIERNTHDQIVGSIFKGRIKNLEPSLQAAFVDIGCGKNAFLHYEDMIPAVKELDEEERNSSDEEALPAPSIVSMPKEAPRKGFFARMEQLTATPATVAKPQPQPIPPQVHAKGGTKYTNEELENLFKPEQEILVQVIKAPIMTKGARVTTNISLPGRYLVLLPGVSHIGISRRVEEKSERDRLRQMVKTLELPPNTGVICRTVGKGCKTEHFQRDLELLLNTWKTTEELAATSKAPACLYQEPGLAERTIRDCLTQDVDEIVTDSRQTYDLAVKLLTQYNLQNSTTITLYQNPTPIFQKFGLHQQLESIFNRKVALPSGGYICIDETEALIAIDVNTGKNRTGKDKPETILNTTLEAVA